MNPCAVVVIRTLLAIDAVATALLALFIAATEVKPYSLVGGAVFGAMFLPAVATVAGAEVAWRALRSSP